MNLKQLPKLLVILLISSCASNGPGIKDQTIAEKKAELYYDQGTTDLVQKNYAKALSNLLKAKEFNPNDYKIRTNLAMAYYFRDQKNFAIQELKESITMEPKNSDAKMNLATIYLEQNKLKEAKELYTETLTDLTYKALYRVHYNLALLNLKIGDRKSAIEELGLSIKEKDDYCQSHFKLGEIYTEEYRFKEAHASYIESTKGTCVSSPEPHFAVANSLINLNRLGEAHLKLQEIITKFPKSNFKLLAEKKIRNLTQDSREESTQLRNNTNTQTQTKTKTTETPKF